MLKTEIKTQEGLGSFKWKRIIMTLVSSVLTLFYLVLLFEFNNRLLRLILVCVGLLIVFFHLCKMVRYVRSCSPSRMIYLNLALSFYTVFGCFLIFEGAMLFIPRSHNVASKHNLSYVRWKFLYWKPINQFGFRDRRQNPTDTYKKNILLVGDSFAAGFGIKDIRNRFGNVLERQLGNDYRLYTVAKPGWATRQEYDNLVNFPVKPDAVILTYIGNDMNDMLGLAETNIAEFVPEQLSPKAKYLLTRSHLINYLYFSFYLHPVQKGFLSKYLVDFYQNEERLKTHQKDLIKFVNYSKRKKIPLIVVIFPHLRATEASKIFINPIRDFFEHQNITVLDVSELANDIPVSFRMVSAVDNHPSVELHRKVGNALLPILQSALPIARSPTTVANKNTVKGSLDS